MLSRFAEVQDNTLAQCMYFSEDSSGLSGVAYRSIWEKLRCFGEVSGIGYLWEATRLPSDRPKKLRLGVVKDLDQFCADPQSQIIGGASFSDRTFPNENWTARDLAFAFHPSSVWSGLDIPARSSISVSDRWISKVGVDKVLDVMRTHIALADAASPLYGFIDFSSSNDVLYGGVYQGVTYLETPFHRWVEQSRFLTYGIRKGQVRSVYWGNYLSREHIKKLGGDGFISRFREFARIGSDFELAILWEFENGVFLSVNPDPTIGCGVGKSMSLQTVNIINWLVGEFCESGLL